MLGPVLRICRPTCFLGAYAILGTGPRMTEEGWAGAVDTLRAPDGHRRKSDNLSLVMLGPVLHLPAHPVLLSVHGSLARRPRMTEEGWACAVDSIVSAGYRRKSDNLSSSCSGLSRASADPPVFLSVCGSSARGPRMTEEGWAGRRRIHWVAPDGHRRKSDNLSRHARACPEHLPTHLFY